MKAGFRGPRRVARTHQTIETALRGVASLALVALLVGETPLASTAHLLTRQGLDEHLQRQQARCVHEAQQRAIGDIRAAVKTAPPNRAPVLIATREGRVILQWVEGEPPPAPEVRAVADRRSVAHVTGEARRAVMRILAREPKTGVYLREALSRYRPSVIGDAITVLHAEGLIEATERRGRWVTWQITDAGREWIAPPPAPDPASSVALAALERGGWST